MKYNDDFFYRRDYLDNYSYLGKLGVGAYLSRLNIGLGVVTTLKNRFRTQEDRSGQELCLFDPKCGPFSF